MYCCATSSSRRRRRDVGCAARPGGSARSTSRRRSVSATHSATPRSRTSYRLHPDAEIDWLAQRGDRCSRGARRARSSGERVALERVGPHGVGVGRARPPLLPGLAQDGRRDPARELHGLPRRRAGRPYGLWIGDEAWELDYYLHENREEKRAAYVWLTDFIGWLPMETAPSTRHTGRLQRRDGRASLPRVRDRALYVRSLEDVTPEPFGPELPFIPDWTKEHFAFPGYVTGFDPAAIADREALRAELGYRSDEQVCVVTVGLRRRRRPAATRRRVLSGGQGARSRAADGRRHGPAHRPGDAPRASGASRSVPMSTSSTGISPPATSRSSRAG